VEYRSRRVQADLDVSSKLPTACGLRAQRLCLGSIARKTGGGGRGRDRGICEVVRAQDVARPVARSCELINGPDNLVRIPTLKHWEITGWYMTKNENFGGLSPREYLRDKDWAERRRVGLFALIDKGVLEP
jgi:hypothetical protein